MTDSLGWLAEAKRCARQVAQRLYVVVSGRLLLPTGALIDPLGREGGAGQPAGVL
jgi:hypothetical protein